MIGNLPFTPPQVQSDNNILLAAKIWKIVEVDTEAGKIFVVPALDGKSPLLSAAGG